MKSTYRPDYRYVYAKIRGIDASERECRTILKEILAKSLGMMGLYEIEPVIIDCKNEYVIIRCIRGTEDRLCAVLALIDSNQRQRLHIEVERISGTLRSIAQNEKIRIVNKKKLKKKKK